MTSCKPETTNQSTKNQSTKSQLHRSIDQLTQRLIPLSLPSLMLSVPLSLPLAASANAPSSHLVQPVTHRASLVSQLLLSQMLFSQTTVIDRPDTAITPMNSKVNLRFVNLTGAKIDYQVISDTEFRTLAGRSEMTLQHLPVPMTFTFRRQDSGFLQLSYQSDQPSGTLVVTVQETPDFASDRTSIYIDPNGKVYFN